jgi:protein transport protein HofB
MLDAYIQAHDATGLLDACLRKACAYHASDIHIEPLAEGWQIRLRVDGLLHVLTLLPTALGLALVVRIKLLGQMDIGETRQPQDGRFQTAIDQQQLHIRCSSLPGHLGEKLVLRLQNPSSASLAIEELGMLAEQRRILAQYLTMPQGLIMVTGPTGSGKSITLYAALMHLLEPQRNIMTLEDPVEVVIPGIHQVAPKVGIGVDFNTLLRALLRQDPDVIMLGELRDRDSAQTAVRAAQTGHLILTSMHTNTALEAISRCYGLGIDLQGLSYCLQLVINQRLLRRLCGNCAIPVSASLGLQMQGEPWQRARMELQAKGLLEQPRQPMGCEHCHGGYHGRFGVFELWPVEAQHRTAIANGELPHVAELIDLQQQAMLAVLAGRTSLAEMARVLV